MKIPTLQAQLDILFNRYGNGPINIETNKEEAQAFISRLIDVGIEADEQEEYNACKAVYTALWNKKDKKVAEEQYAWFWLNY